MSTAAGYAAYPVGQSCDNDHGMINLDVRTLTGEEFRLRVERSTLGSDVRKMVSDHLPGRSGAKLVLDHMRHQTSSARCGGNSEIEVAPNFARTRLRRGRNSNFVLYLCANPVAGCMVLLNGGLKPLKQSFPWKG